MQAHLVLAVLAGGAYVVASQWLMVSAPSSPWSAVVLLAPMLAAVCGWAWHARQHLPGLCAGGAIVALLVLALTGTSIDAEKLYVAQHAGVHACLAVWFGSTLRAGVTPFITKLAARVHKHLTPPLRAYTRNVTLAWTLYFVALCVLSLALYAGAAFTTWATFANLLTPVTLALMFGGEHVLRYRLHPEFERVTMLDAVRAYRQPAPAAPPANTGAPV